MTTFYKATSLTGHDFRTGSVDYAGALATGEPVRHQLPGPMVRNQPVTYLSVSVEPAETLIGGAWPCRLFVVEPVGEVLDNLEASRYKRACLSMRVVEELPAHLALGPNGARVAALIERGKSISYAEAKRWGAAWDAARDAARDAAWYAARDAAWYAARDAAWDAARGAAWDAARGAARGAAWDAARGAAWDAARDAALAELSRDLITEAQYLELAGPWISVMGEIQLPEVLSVL
jgi:hypothetical protein